MRLRGFATVITVVSLAANAGFLALGVKGVADRGGIEYIRSKFARTNPVMTVDQFTNHLSVHRAIPLDENEVIFVGDSLVASYPWAEAFSGLPIRNFGIGGDRTTSVLTRLHTVTERGPAAVFIMIGTNDIGDNRAPADIARDIETAVDRIADESPATRVVLHAVPPRQGPIHNGRVSELNERIAGIAAARDLTLIDFSRDVANEQGGLAGEYTTDGLHLTAAAYDIWLDAIRPLVIEATTGRSIAAISALATQDE